MKLKCFMIFSLLLCNIALNAQQTKTKQNRKESAKRDSTLLTPSKPNQQDNATIDRATEHPEPKDANAAPQLYLKYDFIAGDSIQFEENMLAQVEGTVPNNWQQMASGVTSVKGTTNLELLWNDGTKENPYFLKPLSNGAGMILKGDVTFEMDFLIADAAQQVVLVLGKNGLNNEQLIIDYSGAIQFKNFTNPIQQVNYSNGAENYIRKWHHLAVHFLNQQMKIYVDQFVVLETTPINCASFDFQIGGATGNRVSYVKIANGPGTKRVEFLNRMNNAYLHQIRFKLNTAELKPESMGVLNQLTFWLIRHKEVIVGISGYTDLDAYEASTTDIATQRATAIRNQLIAMGVPAQQLVIKNDEQALSNLRSIEAKFTDKYVVITPLNKH